jgi:multiple antibiotic resistance protein
MHLLFYFFVMLNPVALFLYVLPLKKEVGLRHFLNIMARASLISFFIYALFALFGEAIFSALRIKFDSFRIFGGIVVSALALSYILQGKKSMITTRGEYNQIASEIALPFIVGAGTITISILIGRQLGKLESVIGIAMVLLANLGTVALLAYFRYRLRPKIRIVFDKNAEIMLRINGFIVGAFGIDLIVTGIRNLSG